MSKKTSVPFAIAILVSALISPASASSGGDAGELHGYIDFMAWEDLGQSWTGSETTFASRVKLDYTRPIDGAVSVRISGMHTPTVSDQSRAYETMKKREFDLEDSYLRFDTDSSEVRFGVVKVPFGIFNLLSLEGRNRPHTFGVTREWDTGLRYDRRFEALDLSFAAVNGNGREGTDPNSDKSLVLRLGFPASSSTLYPETFEAADYPNPATVSESSWQMGISVYFGDKNSTPIKIQNKHYAIDVDLRLPPVRFLAQATYIVGGYTYSDMPREGYAGPDGWVSGLDDFMDEFQYSGAVVYDIGSYANGISGFAALEYGVSDKSVVSLMYEYLDPDTGSGATPMQAAKERMVVGLKREIRPNVALALFYTVNNDPVFGKVNADTGRLYDITDADSQNGDDVTMLAIAARF